MSRPIDNSIHNSLFIWTHAARQTKVQSSCLLFFSSPLCLSLLFLAFPLPSLSTEQGQLENIPFSFLAQARHSPGPLIKHKPSPFLSFSSLFLPHSVSALSPLSICLDSSCSLSPSLPSSQQPLSINSIVSPSSHSSLLALHPSPSLPICHARGLIFTLGQSSESICTKHWTCYSLLLVLTMRPVTSAM